jgi:hypothetical protein
MLVETALDLSLASGELSLASRKELFALNALPLALGRLLLYPDNHSKTSVRLGYVVICTLYVTPQNAEGFRVFS